jgi:hypothetical protein
MRAIVQDRYGSPDHLRLKEVDVPALENDGHRSRCGRHRSMPATGGEFGPIPSRAIVLTRITREGRRAEFVRGHEKAAIRA